MVTVFPDASFTGSVGRLTGDTTGSFAVTPVPPHVDLAEPCAQSTDAQGFIASALKGTVNGSPSNRVLVVATNLHHANAYTASVVLSADPSAAPTTLTIHRTYQAKTAAWWILLGSLIASAVGILGTVVLKRAKTSVDVEDLQARLVAARTRFEAAFLPVQDLFPAASVTSTAWAVPAPASGTDASGQAAFAVRVARYEHAVAAAVGACGDLAQSRADSQGAARALFASLVAAVELGPELDSDSPDVVQAQSDAQPWLLVLDECNAALAVTPHNTSIQRIRRKVLAVDATSLPNRSSALAELGKLVQNQLTPVSTATPPAAQPLMATPPIVRRTRPTQGPRPVVATVAPDSLNTLRQDRLRAKLSKWEYRGLETAVVAIALAVSEVLALSTQYYSKDVWGSTGDVLAAITWAFGAAGAIQVSKVAFLATPAISVSNS